MVIQIEPIQSLMWKEHKKCDRTTLNNYDIDPRFSEYLIRDSDGVHFDVEGYLADINT